MSIVIRPSPGVFRRTTPLVVVFGAFRRYETDRPLSQAELETITGVVGGARRFRTPLAFSRVVGKDGLSGPGVWLPGCRPKVTDRVFDHAEGSAFGNREFANVFTKITEREIVMVGPENDSSRTATLADSKAYDRPVRVIMAGGTLHNCSSALNQRSQDDHNPSNCDQLSAVNFEEWERELCVIEYVR